MIGLTGAELDGLAVGPVRVSDVSPVKVFFFRGLNTSGLDEATLGPWNFGYMHRHFEPAFARRGVELHGILGMGVGPLVEVAARARASLLAHPLWQSGEPVHFFGHSAGGLVARMLLRDAMGS